MDISPNEAMTKAREIADALSEALEQNWTATEGINPRMPHITGPLGMRLWLRWTNGRLEIHGQLDYGYATSIKDPSITVDSERPADKIAAEITRRLLPGYRALFEAGRSAKARQAEEQAAKAALTTKLLAMLRMPSASVSSAGTVYVGDSGNAITGTIEVYSVSMTLILRASEEAGLLLARVIRQLNEEKS
jgi:hypothetical protein